MSIIGQFARWIFCRMPASNYIVFESTPVLSDNAKAVYDEMVRRGIDPKRMKWQGKGEREPIETNRTEEGRAANRRVEFRIL